MSAIARRYFVRARQQLGAGDTDGASESFAAAVELAPGFVAARSGWALLLARTDPPRAAQLLRAGLRGATRPGDRRPLLCALGDVLTAAGDFLGADEAYAEAATLPGGSSALDGRLAKLRAKSGRYAEAFAALARAARPPR